LLVLTIPRRNHAFCEGLSRQEILRVGVQICEHMPLQAAMMGWLALIRGIRSVESDHYLSEVYTGLPRSSGKRPAFRSIVGKLAPTKFSLPTYASLSHVSEPFDYEKPHYAGAGHAPSRPLQESLDQRENQFSEHHGHDLSCARH
jgi:hypothetical protein